MAMFAAYDALSSPFAEALPFDSNVPTDDIDLTSYDAKKLVASYRRNIANAKATHDQIKTRRSNLDTFMNDLTILMDTCRKIANVASTREIDDVDGKELDAHMKVTLQNVIDFKKNYITAEEKAIKELRQQEESAQNTLTILREALVKGAKLMANKDEPMPQSNTCPICFEKEINRVCVPCGHTLCSSCEFSVAEKCATCRRYVDMCIPIYFSL
jgi:hypothetical protein